MSRPDLTAVIVVGTRRKRAQRSLDSLGSQTAASRMEVLIMDLSDEDTPPLVAPPAVQVDFVRRPGWENWCWARAEAVRRAQSPVVAFIEDHCYASPRWAEHLLDAYQGPWAAVGYGFANANPETFIARTSFVDAYGRWSHLRPPGPTRFLPGQNVSYRRESLLSFGERLGRLLTPDFVIHEAMIARDMPLFSETRAVAAHENFEFVGGQLGAHFAFARLLAARRAESKKFSLPRRLFYGLAVIPGAPLINTARLVRAALMHPEMRRSLLPALPICTATYLISCFGESLGYLIGQGSSEEETIYWEAGAERRIAK